MQTFKFTLKSSTSQICIADMMRELYSTVAIHIVGNVEFDDLGFTGDLYEIAFVNNGVAGLVSQITGKVISEVLSSSGDDDFYDDLPDLMSQFNQLLTQAKTQTTDDYDVRVLNHSIKIYNDLLQYQGDEDHCLFDGNFNLEPIEPIE